MSRTPDATFCDISEDFGNMQDISAGQTHFVNPAAAAISSCSAANLRSVSMTNIEKVLYTGKTRTTGGRDGASQSDDGQLDIKLSPPGSARPGTNPEQLFAAGWSACFIGAMGIAAGKLKIRLPAETAVNAEVDLGTTDGDYFLQARLKVSLPGIEPDVAKALVDEAHRLCPYSKATRGNIHVELSIA
jgi:Ohr subfamily peroxiredoxin